MKTSETQIAATVTASAGGTCSPPFPIMSEYEHATRKQYPGITIPWAMMAPHEAQAAKNHLQSLETLARRGGLGRCEACAVLEDREWRKMTDGEADAKLAEHVRSFLANTQEEPIRSPRH